MLAGYVFWRWWMNQPGNYHDDEKGHVHRILGEPRHRRILSGRSRRGGSNLDLARSVDLFPHAALLPLRKVPARMSISTKTRLPHVQPDG